MERRSIALAAIVTAAVTLASGCASTTAGHASGMAPAGAANPVGTTSPAGPTSPASTAGPDATATATTPAPSRSAAAVAAYDPQAPTISDGTSTVMVGGRAAVFPSTVTDAAWSPNGTMLAYVDGDGGIAIAHADGTHVQVLVKGGAGVERARPAWDGDRVAYAERVKGSWTLREAALPYAGYDATRTDWDWGLTNEIGNAAPFTVASVPGVMAQDPPKSQAYGGHEYVAQVEKNGRDEVFVFDRNLRGDFGSLTFAGTDPALSPDGTQVVFVGANGQLEVARTKWEGDGRAPAGPHQLTFGADHPSHPAWSADGGRVAFQTSDDVESVASSVKAGATSNPARQESAKPGVPSYPAAPPAVATIDGSDAVAASIAMSKAQYPTAMAPDQLGPMTGHPTSAVLVADDSDAAAASAAYLAWSAQPLLFTKAGSLDPRTAAELKRLFGPCLHAAPGLCQVTRPTLKVVGTEKEFPAAVVNQLKAEGFDVTRITAADPADLALSGAPPRTQAVFVVDPADHAAALAAIEAARDANGVVVLTDGPALTPAARAYLKSVDFSPTPAGPVTVTAVGGNAATAVAARWTGKPSFQVTNLTGDAPAAQVGMVHEPYREVPSTAVLVAAQGNRAVFALSGTVIPADPTATDFTALMNHDDAGIRTIWSLGTPSTAMLDGLESALGVPTPLAVAPAPAATAVVMRY